MQTKNYGLKSIILIVSEALKDLQLLAQITPAQFQEDTKIQEHYSVK